MSLTTSVMATGSHMFNRYLCQLETMEIESLDNGQHFLYNDCDEPETRYSFYFETTGTCILS